MLAINNIEIFGRRWFQASYGNTYFSSLGIVDGKIVVEIDFEYGYGNHFSERTFDAILKTLDIDDREEYPSGSKEADWRFCERHGIEYSTSVTDVQRKKDL